MKNSLLMSLLLVTSLTQGEAAPQADPRKTAMAPVIQELPTNSIYQRQAKQLSQSSSPQKVTNQQKQPQQRSGPVIGQHRNVAKQPTNQLTSPQIKQGVAPKQSASITIGQHRAVSKTVPQNQTQLGNFLTDAELVKHYTAAFGQKDLKSVKKLTARIWNNYLSTHKMPANNDPHLKAILLEAFEKESRIFSLLNVLSKKDPRFQEAYQLSALTIKILDLCLQNDGTKSLAPEQRQAVKQQQKKYQAAPVAGDSSIGRLLRVSRVANILEAPMTPPDATLLAKLQSKGKLSADEAKRLKSIEMLIQQNPSKYKGTATEKLYDTWKTNYPAAQGMTARTKAVVSSAAKKVTGAFQKINPFKKKTDDKMSAAQGQKF
ncbi:MAG: hypothetical protein K0M45_06280 [Candidatus Paracaedibacteraceae bacterium]|nr:hypothetical protein [Candidatus Paracaedibacteraceae bacterium]